jgi:hypothetical protein
VQNVKSRLDAWRDAERRRDGLALGSPVRQAAEEEVRIADKTFHAELAQASAQYAEQEFRSSRPGWSAHLDRRISGAVD